jgi:hypothetical protein
MRGIDLMSVSVCVCVCVRERERERACVCERGSLRVCGREREIIREREREPACASVCVRPYVRKRESLPER